jgi:hypothetical protein
MDPITDQTTADRIGTSDKSAVELEQESAGVVPESALMLRLSGPMEIKSHDFFALPNEIPTPQRVHSP